MYTVGSVAAFAVSQFVFLLCYGPEWTSPQVASVLAFAVGAPVNYGISRRWAWQRRDRPGLRDEVLPYAGIILSSIAASAVGTWAVDRWLQSAGLPRLAEVVIVGTTFALINGGLFLAKYVLLNRLVFRDRSPHHDESLPDAEPVP
jgi:putative flippase GtrA